MTFVEKGETRIAGVTETEKKVYDKPAQETTSFRNAQFFQI
jgi:hypothetical protein